MFLTTQQPQPHIKKPPAKFSQYKQQVTDWLIKYQIPIDKAELAVIDYKQQIVDGKRHHLTADVVALSLVTTIKQGYNL